MPRLTAYLSSENISSKIVDDVHHLKIPETKEKISSDQLDTTDKQFQTAATRLEDAYRKRVREHGKRVYRWPDGSLREEKPSRNPFAASNRQKWAPIVQHCRMNGGDRSYETSQKSYRYALGTAFGTYKAYIARASLVPEFNEDGSLPGYDPNKLSPLDDPLHCFHTYYKAGAAAVFAHSRGRLL